MVVAVLVCVSGSVVVAVLVGVGICFAGFGRFLEAAIDHALGHDGNAAHDDQEKRGSDHRGTPRGL